MFVLCIDPHLSCSDLNNLTKDLTNIMKQSKIEANLKEHKKQSVREIEDRIISMGKKARNEVSSGYIANCMGKKAFNDASTGHIAKCF